MQSWGLSWRELQQSWHWNRVERGLDSWLLVFTGCKHLFLPCQIKCVNRGFCCTAKPSGVYLFSGLNHLDRYQWVFRGSHCSDVHVRACWIPQAVCPAGSVLSKLWISSKMNNTAYSTTQCFFILVVCSHVHHVITLLSVKSYYIHTVLISWIFSFVLISSTPPLC